MYFEPIYILSLSVFFFLIWLSQHKSAQSKFFPAEIPDLKKKFVEKMDIGQIYKHDNKCHE